MVVYVHNLSQRFTPRPYPRPAKARCRWCRRGFCSLLQSKVVDVELRHSPSTADEHRGRSTGEGMAGDRRQARNTEPQVPSGFPEMDMIRIEPVRAALEGLIELALLIESVGGECEKSRGLRHATEVARRSIWAAATIREKRSPEKVSKLLEKHLQLIVTPETIRNWCKAGRVDYQLVGSNRYMVYYDSVLAYAQNRLAGAGS